MAWQYALAAATQIAGGLIGKSANAKAAKIARKTGELNAELIQLETETNITRIRQQARKLVGTQASLYAKGGVRAREGSAYDVAMETQIMAEQDVMLTAYEGKIRGTIARLGGQSESQGLNYAGTADLIQGVGGAISTYSMGS